MHKTRYIGLQRKKESIEIQAMQVKNLPKNLSDLQVLLHLSSQHPVRKLRHNEVKCLA